MIDAGYSPDTAVRIQRAGVDVFKPSTLGNRAAVTTTEGTRKSVRFAKWKPHPMVGKL